MAPVTSPPHVPSSRRNDPRVRAALLFGLGGAGIGGALSFVMAGCTTCAVGQDVLGFAAIVGVAAAYGGWSGYSRR